jgi:N-acetylglucosaminyl-diphospho-decaprenol L-rhamnosyltransferase
VNTKQTTPSTKPLEAPQENRDLAILTVAYKSDHSLIKLASSIAKQSIKPAAWLIVDNSPANLRLNPECLQLCGETIKIHVLTGQEDAGFAAGCNTGLQWLDEQKWAGWAWLLNPDTIFCDDNTIAKIIRDQHGFPVNALIGTAVRDSNGELEQSAGWINQGLNFRKQRISQANLPDPESASTIIDVNWLSGCSMLLQPAILKQSPRFDEQFPLYYEDLDFCLRQAAHGIGVVWSNVVTVQHQRGEGSRTPSQRRLRLSTVGYLRFLQRHRPRWQLYLRSLRLLIMAFGRLPVQPRRALAVLQGWWEAMRYPIQ